MSCAELAIASMHIDISAMFHDQALLCVLCIIIMSMILLF